MRSAYVELSKDEGKLLSLRFSRLNKLFIVPFLFQLYFFLRMYLFLKRKGLRLCCLRSEGGFYRCLVVEKGRRRRRATEKYESIQ